MSPSFLDTIKTQILHLPPLASEHGRDVDNLIVYVHLLMLVLFVGWFSYFVYCLIRFNKSRNPKADYHGVRGHLSSYLEVAVAGIEAVLLLGFAIPLWAKAVDGEKFPSESQSTVIRVTAQQFAWNSRYPGKDGVFGKQDINLRNATNQFGVDMTDPASKDDVVPPINDIWVPVNKPVVVKLTSLDVIHCFKVPALRMTQDAIPGMMIPLHFTPTREGKYPITCAQLCGNSHYFMKGYLTVTNQAAFDKWMAEKAATSSAPGSFE